MAKSPVVRVEITSVYLNELEREPRVHFYVQREDRPGEPVHASVTREANPALYDLLLQSRQGAESVPVA
jgi:hypothetical protein